MDRRKLIRFLVLPAGLIGLAVSGTASHSVSNPGASPADMVWIPGGEFSMGSDDPKAREDESPVHRVRVSGFWMDQTTVTNAQFQTFVDATGYITVAERRPDWEELKQQLPEGTPKPAEDLLVPGSAVFHPTAGAVDLGDWSQWWSWKPGADWRHPSGPGSSIEGRRDHPVVQVAWEDAEAYAKWAGKQLPTEAQWEYAARGGLDGKRFAWGDAVLADGKYMANFWQGPFPAKDAGEDGFTGTAPVKSFPPNGYGLYEITGNTWQFVADWYRADTYRGQARAGLAVDPAGPTASLDPDEPTTPKRVIRGGSFLCSEVVCFSYRPAARMKVSADTGLQDVSFRLVKRP